VRSLFRWTAGDGCPYVVLARGCPTRIVPASRAGAPSTALRAGPRYRSLLLEEIFEGCAGIHGLGRTGRGGFLFYANSHGKERALVAFIFARDSLGDGLGAFEAAGSIEIRTLAAGVKFETALRTFPNRFGDRSQQSAALRAARNRMRSRHLQSARTESFFLDRFVGGWLWPVFVAASVFIAVLIAVLAILLGHARSSAASGYCLASVESPQVRWWS